MHGIDLPNNIKQLVIKVQAHAVRNEPLLQSGPQTPSAFWLFSPSLPLPLSSCLLWHRLLGRPLVAAAPVLCHAHLSKHIAIQQPNFNIANHLFYTC